MNDEDLFGDSDENLLDSVQRGRLAKSFEGKFNLWGNGGVLDGKEIEKEEFIYGVWLLSLAKLAEVDYTDLISSVSNLCAIEHSSKEWSVPNNTPEAILSFIRRVSSIRSPNEYKTLPDITFSPEEIEEVQNEEKKVLNNQYTFEDEFEGNGFSDEDEIRPEDENISKEDIDIFWNSSDIKIMKKDSNPISSSFPSIATLLDEEIDYETLEEDFERELSKTEETKGLGDSMTEDSMADALAFALGADHVMAKLPSGKVDEDARNLGALRILMTDIGIDGEEDFNTAILSHNPQEKEYIHDSFLEIGEEEEEEEPTVEENENVPLDPDVSVEEEVEYEYVDEDGNTVDEPENSEEYEEIEVEDDETPTEELRLGGGFEYYGIESDDENESIDGLLDDKNFFGEEEMEMQDAAPVLSWQALMGDL